MSMRQSYRKFLPGLYIVQRLINIYQIYTDGFKNNDRVGCAAIVNNLTIKQRLTSNASIFTTEITAIDLALDVVSESENDYFIIFSDSLSVLLSLHNMKGDNPLILKKLCRKFLI